MRSIKVRQNLPDTHAQCPILEHRLFALSGLTKLAILMKTLKVQWTFKNKFLLAI